MRGPNLFREYWRRPGATADAFTTDGWFCTGALPVAPPNLTLRCCKRMSECGPHSAAAA